MPKLIYDAETKDLCNLAAQRVAAAAASVQQLCRDHDQGLQVALMACAAALGSAAARVSAKYGWSESEAKTALVRLLLNDHSDEA